VLECNAVLEVCVGLRVPDLQSFHVHRPLEQFLNFTNPQYYLQPKHDVLHPKAAKQHEWSSSEHNPGQNNDLCQ